MPGSTRAHGVLALLASVLGLIFAASSTVDYASHLDRKLHDVHCSFIPGAPPTSDAEGCRAAMYSPYSALLKDAYWGGIPISLFALGAFAFFLGFALYLLLAGSRAPGKALGFLGALGFTPLLASAVMFTISVTKLGHLCNTCVGLYISSGLLAVAGIFALLARRGDPMTGPPPKASWVMPAAWLVMLGVSTLTPAVVYAAGIPDHGPFLTRCGQIKVPKAKPGVLLKMRGAEAVKAALFFEDPLCPTCKAFHERLVVEGALERFDAELALFPLDSECNWMLGSALHPGACLVSKAVLCGGDQAKAVLEWAYDEQERLTLAGKAGKGVLRATIVQRWGEGLGRCLDDRKTDVRLNEHLHFASENQIPVSTPQMYLGNLRICDEDTDLGLRYTLRRLAPEVVP